MGGQKHAALARDGPKPALGPTAAGWFHRDLRTAPLQGLEGVRHHMWVPGRQERVPVLRRGQRELLVLAARVKDPRNGEGSGVKRHPANFDPWNKMITIISHAEAERAAAPIPAALSSGRRPQRRPSRTRPPRPSSPPASMPPPC